MKGLQYKENELQKISCGELKNRVKEEIEKLVAIGDRKSRRYKDLIEQWNQLKSYERYFEYQAQFGLKPVVIGFIAFYMQVSLNEKNKQVWIGF